MHAMVVQVCLSHVKDSVIVLMGDIVDVHNLQLFKVHYKVIEIIREIVNLELFHGHQLKVILVL